MDRTVRKKHKLALVGSYSDIIDCDVEFSCIKVSKQHDFHWVQ